MRKRRALILLLLAVLLLTACGAERSETQASPTETPDASPMSSPALKAPNDNSGVKLVGTPVGTLDCKTEFGTVFSEIW